MTCIGGTLGMQGLKNGVTDAGLSALAAAGCGAQLTSLTLRGEVAECEEFGVGGR